MKVTALYYQQKGFLLHPFYSNQKTVDDRGLLLESTIAINSKGKQA